jgi:CubicO group peptidase (beta-lactamase class C family)
MRSTIHTLASALAVVSLSVAATAQAPLPPASSVSDAEITQGVAALVDRYRELGSFNGRVLVARGDTVLYRGAAGLATLDHAAQLTAASPLRIVGITQLFTAALALTMAEQGTLDDPVGTVTQIPEFVRTIAMPRTLYELTQVILGEPPVGPPGTFRRAQNSDYHLLAAVLETAGGAPFDALLDRHILTPLGLTHTGFDDPNAVIAGRAVGMVRRDGALRHASRFHMSNAVGMAHLVSTVDDVHRFVRAFLSGTVVSGALVDLATQGHVAQLPPGVTLPPDFPEQNVPYRGFGWSVTGGALSNVTSINGATASLQVSPATGVIVVVLSNVASRETHAVTAAIQSIVQGNPLPPGQRLPLVKVK